MPDETLANIKQMFRTIRLTPPTADHTVYLAPLENLAKTFNLDTDGVQLMWKRLQRVQHKNPAIIKIAWQNYVLQLEALEIYMETCYNNLQTALKAAQEKEADICEESQSCQDAREAANPPTPETLSTTTEGCCVPETPCGT